MDSLNLSIELDHPLKSDSYSTEVLGSCHGLLCLSNTEELIVLWNPSTRKHYKIPFSEIEFPPEFTIAQYIVYGLGYDSVNEDFKFVRIVQFYGVDDDSFDSEVKVYSLKSNSWRRIQDFPYYVKYKRMNDVVVNGIFHWVVCRKPESDTANLIAAFDIGVEEYRSVPQPDYLDGDFHMNVGVLGGCLYVMSNYIGKRVDIWVMKEYGVKESWTKLFSVDIWVMILILNSESEEGEFVFGLKSASSSSSLKSEMVESSENVGRSDGARKEENKAEFVTKIQAQSWFFLHVYGQTRPCFSKGITVHQFWLNGVRAQFVKLHRKHSLRW